MTLPLFDRTVTPDALGSVVSGTVTIVLPAGGADWACTRYGPGPGTPTVTSPSAIASTVRGAARNSTEMPTGFGFCSERFGDGDPGARADVTLADADIDQAGRATECDGTSVGLDNQLIEVGVGGQRAGPLVDHDA